MGKVIKAWAAFYKDKICKDSVGDIDVCTRRSRFNLGHYPQPWSVREIEIRIPIKRKRRTIRERYIQSNIDPQKEKRDCLHKVLLE